VELVRAWLGWPPDEVYRLEALEIPDLAPFTLPASDEAARILRNLDVPPPAAEEVVAAMPTPDGDPEAWWLLERLHDALVRTPPTAPPWPAPQVGDDALSRYFHLYVFLGAVPGVLARHAERGIPTDITWKTLGDVGLQVAHYHARYGRYGFDGAFWIFNHFRGDLFQLGRLQYELGRAGFDSAAFATGDPVLEIHIPAIGPLTPEACDDSLTQARAFFAKHFGQGGYRYGICTSWLLDEQLSSVISETSNIVRFQRRYTHDPDWFIPGDDDTIRFTFGRLPKDLSDLPQNTSLERGIVRHIQGGGHWRIRRGWLEV
jgi:hypothetical protein